MTDTARNKITIALPHCKSIRARYITIGAVAGHALRFCNDCDDIKQISNAMRIITKSTYQTSKHEYATVDINNSGTALRFLTAYIAARPYTNILLTGTQQLCSRPISHLVDTLRKMGANIEYAEREGYAPLHIRGTQLNGGSIKIDASISSQYISALMMITPLLKSSLEINLTGKVVSYQYINLTANVMTAFGVEPQLDKKRITIPNTNYAFSCSAQSKYTKQRDWSAATIWMAAAAIRPDIDIYLQHLPLNSAQPDEATLPIFEQMGVMIDDTQLKNSIKISGSSPKTNHIECNCTDTPDAIPSIVVAACLLGINLKLTGASTLPHKECNRVNALIVELKKCGYTITFDGENTLTHNTNNNTQQLNHPITLSSHDDHRIAMALSLIGLKHDITIEKPQVVDKSYPSYWEEYNKFVATTNQDKNK